MTGKMSKIPTSKLNQANNDIWSKIRQAYEARNWALMAKNLARLHGLQTEYLRRLNFAEHEIRELRIELDLEASQNAEWEKQFMQDIASKNGNLDLVNARLEELFGK